MAKKPASKKSVKKPVRKTSAATKKPAKKAAKKAPKKTAKKSAVKKATKKAAKKTVRKASAKKSMRIAAKKKTKSVTQSPKAKRAAAPSAPPKLPAHRALSAGVVLRTGAGARASERGSGKPGRAARKVNLRTGLTHAAHRRNPALARAPAGPWPAPNEAPSEIALRERILVYVLAIETEMAGAPRGESLPDGETVIRCLVEMQVWIEASVTLRDGRALDLLLFEALLADEMSMLRETMGPQAFDSGQFAQAREKLLRELRGESPSEE